jgi:hypothetical protein
VPLAARSTKDVRLPPKQMVASSSLAEPTGCSAVHETADDRLRSTAAQRDFAGPRRHPFALPAGWSMRPSAGRLSARLPVHALEEHDRSRADQHHYRDHDDRE